MPFLFINLSMRLQTKDILSADKMPL